MDESKNTPDWGAVFREQMNFWRAAMSMISSGHRSMRSWIASNMRHGDARNVDLPWQGAPSPSVVMRGRQPTTAVTVWRPPVALRALSSEDAANAWHRMIGGGARPPSGAGRRDDVSRLFTSNSFYNAAAPASMLEASAFAVATPEQAAAWMAEREMAAERHERASSLWKAHRSRERKREIRRDRAFRLDMMDPYERGIAEMTERYGSRERAEQKAISDSIGWLPKWGQKMLKNSNLSTKNLVVLGKGMKAVPGMNGLTMAMRAHPAIAGAMAVSASIGAMKDIFGKGTTAASTVTKWEQLEYMSGPLPIEFKNAARRAGVKDRADIQRRYARMMMKYGDAESMYRRTGMAAANMPPLARMYLASSLEMDEVDMMIAASISKTLPLSASRKRMSNAGYVQEAMTKASAPGSGFWASFGAVVDTVFGGIPSWLATAALDYFSSGEYDVQKSRAVESAIDSAERAKSGADRPSDSARLDDKQSATSISINIGDIALPGVKDAREFMDEIASISNDAADRNMVLASFDRMVV